MTIIYFCPLKIPFSAIVTLHLLITLAIVFAKALLNAQKTFTKLAKA